MAKKPALRQCVGCMAMRDKREMMRVLKSAEGQILLDVTGRKNGRGAYLCKSSACLKLAGKNRGLERSFKMRMPDEVYEALSRAFEEGRHEADTGQG